MAWPCITRACCINRFWTELDKADIAVPLVFTKYSDVADVQHLHPQPKAVHSPPVCADGAAAASRAPDAAAAPQGDGSSASVMRQDFRAWRVRPEPSCKPKREYQPSETPFITETQYQKDYKPWPIPKKGDHPWIPKTGAKNAPAEREITHREHAPSDTLETGVEKCEIEEKVHEKETKEKKKVKVKKEKAADEVDSKLEKQEPKVQNKGRSVADALNRQIKEEVISGSSYRTEFKAYANVKPVKPIKAKSQYKLAVDEKSNLETSYSATFKGEQTPDNKMLERRRIRSLYSEPGGKEPTKFVCVATRPRGRMPFYGENDRFIIVERSSSSLSRPKKTTSHSKTANKAKAKQTTNLQPTKKKTSASKEIKPEGGVTKKSKEIINRLAEGKD